jgi:xanthine dehydrogenase accessory factor
MTPPSWIDDLIAGLDASEQIVRVILARAEGSTPREIGASMMIYHNHFTGTIGGGALEYEVIKTARQIMNAPRTQYRSRRQYPLGPTLGQCCGGFVEVVFEHICPEDRKYWATFSKEPFILHPDDTALPPTATATSDHGVVSCLRPNRTPLYLYGAGHVGRAVIAVTGGLPLERHWIDTDHDRFPEVIPDDVEQVIAANPAHIAAYAPDDIIHLVMSYSHQIDIEICLAVLKKGRFAHLGLIGSATKKARFLKALGEAGIDDGLRARLVCPIGIPEIGGKDPFRVALSVAGQLSEWTRQDHLELNPHDTA